MYDQADELRELARHAGCGEHPADVCPLTSASSTEFSPLDVAPPLQTGGFSRREELSGDRTGETPAARFSGTGRPRVIVVAGGKGGVGTTTLAVNLALALSRRELRTLLVDAARGGHAATLCRLEPRWTLADVLAGRRTVSEAAQPGPEKLQVLPGAWGADSPADCSPAAVDRLFAQLLAPGEATEVVVFDAGNSPGRLTGRCWQQSDALLVVTTPEAAAVMETYHAIKLFWPRQRTQPIHLLVNRAADRHAADDVYRRLAKACRRFLAVELNLAGHVPAGDVFNPDNPKKTKKGLNLATVPADNRGALSVVDVLLNWSECVRFNGDRGTHLWHERTPASLAP
jgi:flagellar biosynthesis protein FlhG